MTGPPTCGHVPVPSELSTRCEDYVPNMDIEDHIRVEMQPDTFVVLGYFDHMFGELYAQQIKVMLQAP